MAAMDFPSSPTNGQVANGYTYDSAKTAWRKNASITVSVTTSSVAPSNPNPGDQWLYTNEGTLFTWWSDGTSSQWVQSSSVIANADPNPMPAGSIMAWGTNTAPQNWLICDGSAVSRSTYASLFAAIGTTYGTGDGSTTFNLPNMKGKTIVGRDSTDTNFDALNTPSVYVGAKTHTLTASQIPAHSHPNTLSSNTVASSGHNHGLVAGYALIGAGTSLVGREKTVPTWTFNKVHGSSAAGSGTYTLATELGGTTDSPSATTTVGITNANNTGGDGAHNNLQPYIVLNYIIKASAGITPGDSVLTTRVGTLETSVRSVALGGTGASTLTSGSYLKGAGTSAITAQAGIPAGDVTSGSLNVLYGGTGATTGSGLVPIIPTSIAVDSGTASLNTSTGLITLTSAVNVNLRGIFSSNYRNYLVQWVNTPSSPPNEWYFRFLNGTGANTSASYTYTGFYTQSGGTGASSVASTGQVRGIFSYAATMSLNIFAPFQSDANTNVQYDATYSHTRFIGQGGFNATTSFDGFNMYNNTFTGTVMVYGFR